MGGQFKLCHFLILECLTLQWSFNIGFASSEDCNLLGIIPWALRKELWVLQTSWRREGDKTRHYGQEIPRTQKLYEYANRNLATIATRGFFPVGDTISLSASLPHYPCRSPVNSSIPGVTTEEWKSFVRLFHLLWVVPATWKQECFCLKFICVLVDNMVTPLDGDSSIMKNGPYFHLGNTTTNRRYL